MALQTELEACWEQVLGNSGGNYGNVNVMSIMNVVVLSLALSVSVNCLIVSCFFFSLSEILWHLGSP